MAPKKKLSNNAYAYFLMDLRRRMDMQTATEEAARRWPLMSASEKEPYLIQAKSGRDATSRQTSLQENIDLVQKQENEAKLKELNMQDYIKTHIRFLNSSRSVGDEYFHIMHVNNFFVTSNKVYYPAEIALVRFKFKEGILEENIYHSIVRPPKFPIGYLGKAKEMSDDTHKLPYMNLGECNMEDICKDVFQFMNESAECNGLDKLPPIYVKDDVRDLVGTVLQQMTEKYDYEPDLLQVYSLSFLLYTLRNDISNTTVWPSISQSIIELDRDVFDYTLDIACEFHRSEGNVNYCSRSHAIRMAYILCDNCCADMNIQLKPGYHVPSDETNVTVTVADVGGTSSRSYMSSYASSLRSYQTNNETAVDCGASVATDDTSSTWSHVTYKKEPESRTSSHKDDSERYPPLPKTDWRQTSFGRDVRKK